MSLKNRLETTRRSEIKRIRRQIGSLSREQEIAIESLTWGIVNKIIDDPISRLEKVACGTDGSAIIDILFRLFDLQCDRYSRGEDFAEKGERTTES